MIVELGLGRHAPALAAWREARAMKPEKSLDETIVKDDCERTSDRMILIRQTTIQYFLKLVLERNPDVKPQYIMTDFDWAEVNACSAIFAAALILLCWWHVLRAWKKHLRIESYPELWALVQRWLRMTDQREFDTTWSVIQLMVKDGRAPQAFVDYLKEYWMKPNIVRMWSAAENE